MLPHNHFLITGLVLTPVELFLFPEKSFSEIIKIVVFGGFLSAALDLDIYLITVLKSRQEKQLKQFINPIIIYKKFKLFMDTIIRTDVLKIGLITHLAFPLFLILIFYIFSNNFYFTAVLFAAILHIMSDIPNLLKLKSNL